MKPEFSKLILIDFAIINSRYKFFTINDKIENFDVADLFKHYEIDLDYVIRQKEEDNIFNIFAKVSINENANYPGYSIFAEGMGMFEVSKEADEKETAHLINYSGVGIMINNLRSFVLNNSVNFPFGKYIIPAIDLNSLIKSKALELKHRDETHN